MSGSSPPPAPSSKWDRPNRSIWVILWRQVSRSGYGGMSKVPRMSPTDDLKICETKTLGSKLPKLDLKKSWVKVLYFKGSLMGSTTIFQSELFDETQSFSPGHKCRCGPPARNPWTNGWPVPRWRRASSRWSPPGEKVGQPSHLFGQI